MFDELKQRGLVKQLTNEEKIRDLLDNQKIVFYIGFDPTADSLHVGHLLQVITAKRLLDAGHIPLMLIGDATALIGDPAGKSEMRKILSIADVVQNDRKIGIQIMKLMGVSLDETGLVRGDSKIKIGVPSNMDWFHQLNFLDFIRNIGAHFSVNNMLRAECFKARLENGGLSFLEFNYMLMQAFDFLKLHEMHDCVLQLGGDDQWSNMLAGIDLVHKKLGREVFALTLPLLANPDGTKMGKTEKGAVWLDPEKTSVFDFFQFWRNLPDDLIIPCLKMFTFFDVAKIEKRPFNTAEEKNLAKKTLAFEMTRFVHGNDLAEEILLKAEKLFEQKDMSSIRVEHPASDILLDIIVAIGFAKSKTDARNLIKNRGICINDEVIEDPFLVPIDKFGKEFVMRRGKKEFCRIVLQ